MNTIPEIRFGRLLFVVCIWVLSPCFIESHELVSRRTNTLVKFIMSRNVAMNAIVILLVLFRVKIVLANIRKS